MHGNHPRVVEMREMEASSGWLAERAAVRFEP
jgi:hypothetical protein